MTHHLNHQFESAILTATGSSALEVSEVIQELWSGYGKILRINLSGSSRNSVIVKHVRVPNGGTHPRGWNTDLSHQRKLKSYQVETTWYRQWSQRCGETCRNPRLLACDQAGDEILLVLEDLDDAGYPTRFHKVNRQQIDTCIAWLANFHATFLGATPEGLWKTGTYWHLETRSDELDALDDMPLKNVAPSIDLALNQARYQTIVHGDAKLANFCFSKDGSKVAAVDFQYVGGGCGMKDLAYFIGSCLNENECEEREGELLDAYFSTLRRALAVQQPDTEASAVESEWRTLFPIAWTDFHRFLKGWSPGHWKINSYSERIARKVVADLETR